MKHRGNTPAIYVTTRQAFLVQPGETLSRNARFVVGHSDPECIAIAFDESTFEGLRSVSYYKSHAVEVLARVVSRRIEPVAYEELHTLLHALGWPSTEPLGWRNFFVGGNESVLSLASRGLMEPMPGADELPHLRNVWRVTERGKIVAGVPEESL